jgi:hypothetical protein
VHGLLVEQQEDGSTHVSALRSASAASTPATPALLSATRRAMGTSAAVGVVGRSAAGHLVAASAASTLLLGSVRSAAVVVSSQVDLLRLIYTRYIATDREARPSRPPQMLA